MKLKTISTQTRREFCAACTKAAGLVALGAAAGCGGSPTGPSSNAQSLTSVSSTVSGRTVTVPVGAGTPLAAVGAMATTRTSIGTFLLARTSATALSVLTATCTHESSTITLVDGSQFVCPNHGAAFSTSGSVVRGPANRALQQFPATITGDNATFTA
jgi:cytochrome b6-f complex iron-sulfur subunit